MCGNNKNYLFKDVSVMRDPGIIDSPRQRPKVRNSAITKARPEIWLENQEGIALHDIDREKRTKSSSPKEG